MSRPWGVRAAKVIWLWRRLRGPDPNVRILKLNTLSGSENFLERLIEAREFGVKLNLRNGDEGLSGATSPTIGELVSRKRDRRRKREEFQGSLMNRFGRCEKSWIRTNVSY